MKRETEVQPEQVAAELTAASTVKHLVSSPGKQVLLAINDLDVMSPENWRPAGVQEYWKQIFLAILR